MNTMKCLGRAVIRTAVIWGLVFGAVPPGGAQEKTKAQEAAKKTDAAAQVPGAQAQTVKTVESPAAEKSSGGPHEGIKVHGDWVIAIRNEDGSVASRHEFHNFLYSPSPLLILLARNGVVVTQGYTIIINLTIHDLPGHPVFPITDPISNGACYIGEPPGQDTVNVFNNLSVTATSSALVLAGHAKAVSPGRISIVLTQVKLSTGSFVDFTARDLTQPDPPSTTPPPAINVVANQTIDVTVTISFS